MLLFLSYSGVAQTFDINYKTPTTLGTISDPLINEASGLAISYSTNDAFWLHNDSGDGPNLWLINKSGDVLNHGIVKQKNGNNASSRDWEDIASFEKDGKSYLIIGNFGDNPVNKTEYYLYILEEPEYNAQSTNDNAYEILKTITYQYENGSQNCESIGVDVENEQIILVSKSSVGGNKIVYELPLSVTSDDITTTAKIIGQFPMDGTTAMDISNDGQHAIVLTYKDAYEFTRYEGATWEDAFKRAPRQITMPVRNGGEAIAYGKNAIDLYLVREGKSSPVWLVEGEVEQGVLFQVDMRLQTDLYNKQVWVNIEGQANPILMTDHDENGIFAAKVDLPLNTEYVYSFSYQNGESTDNDIVVENTASACANDNGKREVYIGKKNLLLKKVIFNNCDESPNFYIIDHCESVSGWKNAGLSLNTSDKKQGNASVEYSGDQNVEFEKILAEPTHANGTEEGTVLEFWYYISDVSKLDASNQVEITSSGKSDTDEYGWNIDKNNLVNGWNFMELKISEANKTGNPDLTAINYFRLYRKKTGAITSRIDDIQLIGENNPRESDASLSSITIDYGKFTEAFSPGILTYTVEIPFGIETPPTVSATATQLGKAVMTVQQAATMTETATIDVTSEDGTNQRTYTIAFVSSDGKYLDPCEDKTGWNPGAIILNSEDNKQGEYCFENTTSDNLEFSKNFSTPHNANGTPKDVTLSFWYYVSDVSLFDEANQVEITSSGKADEDEYSWSITKSNLNTGWNHIQLNVGEAAITGNPDLEAINFFRIYRKKTGSVTTRIDAINLYGESEEDKEDEENEETKSNDANLGSLNINNGTLSPSFSSDILDYTVEVPEGATNIPEVTATASDQENASILITQANSLEDKTTIEVTAEDGTTKTYTITFLVNIPTSISVNKADLGLYIFPNPIIDVLTIRSQSDLQKVEIYTIGGHKKYSINTLSTVVKINIQHWEKGIYILKITTKEGKILTQKVIK
ncbi:T9SS type A sorting domain-containing protein [Flammeovirga kamogawensis]|uniref:T9SS type A sorting domain-containing protein n=1 Tax=Flammeovirga kamogawensis TaxID=373891 RepID=A0ABX8H3P3_9BACT|nr:T9SS type A sorting domain-containing protein [Flammeovirga kamogawensis]MBB6460439.1 hypothetical protein [Flammeovirga kamogawensis]QWG10244.1 T9SS type A sorting domain-containing protein [Flammeovirga kamogawensis]